MEDEIVEILGLSPEIAEFPHGSGGSTEIGYRAGWARTYLKHAGLIQNSAHGVWSLTPTGKQKTKIDGKSIVREVSQRLREQKDLRGADREINRFAGSGLEGAPNPCSSRHGSDRLRTLVPASSSGIGILGCGSYQEIWRWRH